MSILDSILGQATGGSVGIEGLAQRIGLPPEQVEQAVAALGQAHQQSGDTVQTASDNTGIPTDKLSAIVQHMGGEGALGQFASLLNSSGAGNDTGFGALKNLL